MIPLKYGYLLAVIVGLIGWLWIFITRKDLRKIMLSFGFIFGVLSVVTSYFWWTTDWWHPVTITGTKIGIEDFLSGFGISGVIIAIYAFFFKKKIITVKPFSYKNLISRGSLFILVFILTYFFIHFLRITTFYSIYLTLLIGSIIIFINRRDLLIPGVMTGILMVICISPIYWVVMVTCPSWIQETYLFNHLSGILILGIPIEELIFFFFAGLFNGPFYEFLTGAKFVSKK